MSMRKAALVALCLLVPISSPSAQNRPLQTAMREKLANAQGLLGVIVRGDFDAIVRYGDRLSWITETEIASWQTAATPDYVKQATVFLLSVQGLRDAAKKRDLEDVAQEYSTMVSSCIRCHTIVRTTQRVSLSEKELLLGMVR
jgi:cytochrome c556